MMAGARELEKGPLHGGNLRLAREYFTKALERAQASSDPRDAKLIPKLQEGLSGIADLFSHMPFGGFGGFGGGFDAMYEAMGRFMEGEFYDDDDEFDDFDDDDDFDEELPPRPARAPAPRPAKKGRKRKKKK
jgi:hypothetical protein